MATSVLALEPAASLKPALLERASSAALGQIPVTRRSSQPNYISDLGLRALPDPFDFLQLSLKSFPEFHALLSDERLGRGVDRVHLAWKNGAGTDGDLAGVLDAYVSFAGLWGHARALALRVADDVRRPSEYRTQLYLAAILAATTGASNSHDHTVMDLFQEAAENAPSVTDRCLVRLRSAAWRAKRKNDASSARAELVSIRRIARDALINGEIASADHDIISASTLNLEALTFVRAGENGPAAMLMDEAMDLCQNDLWVTLDYDAGYRYQTQIRTNVAQMAWKLADRQKALSFLEQNLSVTAHQHPSSRSESLSIAAYYYYLDTQHTFALSLAEEAYLIIAAEGSPNRLAKLRKVAVAILDSMQLTDEAAWVLARIEEDPLGFDSDLLGRTF
ncbi:hypothetical protein [Subtercola vilae]|nr:hypothetical protein [Subtercola vilae]